MLKVTESWWRRVLRLFRLARQARDENRPQFWALTESNGPAHFQFRTPLTEAEALAYLRGNFQNATVDYIDYETHIIFYRLGKRA